MFQEGVFLLNQSTTILVRSAIIYQIYDVVFPSQDYICIFRDSKSKHSRCQAKNLGSVETFCKVHPQSLTAGSSKWWFPIGISFSRGWFSGSNVNLQGCTPKMQVPLLSRIQLAIFGDGFSRIHKPQKLFFWVSIPPFKEPEVLGDGRGHLTLLKFSPYPRPKVATKTPCHPKDHNTTFHWRSFQKIRLRKERIRKSLNIPEVQLKNCFGGFFWKSWVFKKLCGIDKTPTWKICEKIQLERYQLDGRNTKRTTWDVKKTL